jgi:hypothetical protein
MSLLLISAVFGADNPIRPLKQRPKVPVRYGPVYAIPMLDGKHDPGTSTATGGPRNVALRGSIRATTNPEVLGTTTYDQQHNTTQSRQVEHRAMYSVPPDNLYGNYIHFDWTDQNNFNYGDNRGIGYQAFEIAGCSYVFEAGGIRIEGAYAGYVGIDADPGGWAVATAHQNDGAVYASKAYWDFWVGGPAYGIFYSELPGDEVWGWYVNNGTGPGNEISWPKIDWDIDGVDPVLHMVSTEFSGGQDPQTITYHRRVGPYGEGNGVWSPLRVIDTIMNISVTVASSPISDRVAVIWNAPCDYKRDQVDEYETQWENDIWFAISTQNGLDWANETVSTALGAPSIGHTVDQGIGNPALPGIGGNLTTYEAVNRYKAYSDLSALFTTTDDLNIVWGCLRFEDTTSVYRRQSAIFHWMEGDPLPGPGRSVTYAEWDTGGYCFSYAWGADAAKMSISECDGKLYCLYTQFGSDDNPCGDVDNVNTITNGYLYVTVFDPVYDAWDEPQRVTGLVETPNGCTPGDEGDCNSEYWATMARYGRIDTCQFSSVSVLDLIYINDKAPGDAIDEDAGMWTTNPVLWWAYPCREAVAEPGYRDDAGPGYGVAYTDQVLYVRPGNDTSITLNIENDGLIENNVAIATSSGDPEVTIGSDVVSDLIPPGTSIPVTITIAASMSAGDPSTVLGTITVTHDADGSPREIPMDILVSSTYVPLQSAELETFCKRLRVYNNGQMSNNAYNASLDFNDLYDPDDCGNVYLYDASPMICRDVGGEMRNYFSVYDNAYTSDHALRQITPLVVDSLGNPEYSYATAEFITGDSAIGLMVEYFAPKAEDSCGFVVQRLQFWNRDHDGEGVTLNGVAVGEVLDWDIPAHEDGSINESGYDDTRNLIYQNCCEHDPCDTTYYCRRAGGIAAYQGTPFKNYMTVENDVYVYESGPFGLDAPFPPDTTYGLMNGNNGFDLATIDTCEDLTTLVTFDIYDLQPHDTQCVVKILATSRLDPIQAELKDNVDKANAFIDGRAEIKCEEPPVPCDCIPGDANGDGDVNVGDAVYLISYVFKSGPAPTPYATCSGDANCDCDSNVGDAVYIITYVFKSGPPPCECEVWRDPENCGPTLY